MPERTRVALGRARDFGLVHLQAGLDGADRPLSACGIVLDPAMLGEGSTDDVTCRRCRAVRALGERREASHA